MIKYRNHRFYTGLYILVAFLIHHINSDLNKDVDYAEYQPFDNDMYRGAQVPDPRDFQPPPNEQFRTMTPKPVNYDQNKQNILALPSNYTVITDWPSSSRPLGSVAAVSYDTQNNIVIFHRGNHVWNALSFNTSHHYQMQQGGPIGENTVIVFDRITGKIVREWGKNLFYMPHGLHIDKDNNAWVTDVALHQIMKFNLNVSSEQPEMTLGRRFIPDKKVDTFCKPTAVITLPSGEFFVADGYCNSRIIKYSKTGDRLFQWGKNSFSGTSFPVAPQEYFAIPHALTLALDLGLLCVADRENGRVQCFQTTNGAFHSQYHSPMIGSRIFSVAYAPIAGGQLFVINGPELPHQMDIYLEIKGFVIDMQSKEVISKFGPATNNGMFANPHDIIVSPDASEIYIVDLNPNKAYKFMLNSVLLTKSSVDNKMEVKPTATMDNNSLNITSPTATTLKTQPGATALLFVTLFVLLGLFVFGLVILIAKKRKRGCIPFGSRNRRHAWDFPTVKTDGTFKLGNLLDRKRVGFEKLDQDASDEEQTNMLSSSNA